MKVLVVDDSPVYRRVLVQALARMGHECAVARDGLEGWALFEREGAEVVISNWLMPGIEGDELCRRIRRSEKPYAYFIFFSARDARKNVMDGMAAGADDYLSKPLDEEELAACLVAAERVTALHHRLGEQQLELERLNRQLFEQARHDPLTGVRNRLRMQEDIETLEGRAEREGDGYAVALCDVDRFKSYNDSRGHLAGDEVLRRIASALERSCRRGDAVYRYGGEELLVLLVDDVPEMAIAAAERMRAAVEALAIPNPAEDPSPVVTVSVGVAVRRADRDGGPQEVLTRADEALYEAKAAGRNRVVPAR